MLIPYPRPCQEEEHVRGFGDLDPRPGVLGPPTGGPNHRVHHVLAQLSETTPLGQDLKQAPFTPKPRTMVVCV